MTAVDHDVAGRAEWAATAPVPDAGTGGRRRRTTRGEDLAFLFFGLWTLGGLCLDGWAHRHQPQLETFFTPWHAVFYSGFIGGASCLAWIVLRARAGSRSLWEAVPDGYELAVIGLGLFAAAGVGDGIWHTIFGVESTIDALLSPTHLVLLVGMLGGITAPFRAAWRDGSGPTAPSLGQFLPPLLSITVAATAVAFFFLYANGFNNWPVTEPLFASGDSQVRAALGVLSVLVTTLVLTTPLMIMLQRWVPPFGTATVLFTVVGVFMAGLDGFEFWWQAIPAVAGGLTADLILANVGGSTRRRALACGPATGLVLATTSLAVIHQWWGLQWPPELWAGAIVMAALAGLAIAQVAHPAPVPGRPT